MSSTKPTLHADGTVTYLSPITGEWVKHAQTVSELALGAMPDDDAAAIREHLGMTVPDQKHTPEPWEADDGAVYSQLRKRTDPIDGVGAKVCQTFERGHAYDSDLINDSTRKANARRIVQCVNACAGIPEPEKTVPEMVAAMRSFVSGAKAAADRGDKIAERLTYHHGRMSEILAKLEQKATN